MKAATLSSIGKILIIIGIINLIILFASQVFSAEVHIIEIRKNLSLKNSDISLSDYYLNAGENLGVKPGTIFTLYRRVSVINRLGSNLAKPLALPVGKIKIIYVSKTMSVARLHELQKFEKSPILEYQGVMLGDLIHVGSAEISSEPLEGDSERKPRDITLKVEPSIVLKAGTRPNENSSDSQSLYPLSEEAEKVLQ